VICELSRLLSEEVVLVNTFLSAGGAVAVVDVV
jgi:hypothetical protein